ncbi:aminopeptidase C [Flavobacterium crassostreae]|uniref:Aminopeptidase n=1 Tax=Flavobacterium crassostreae TaxID=1763534 RepID=A0A1B9E5W5_9FLAO|nr:C1 family peptidase [Flavobacterium crassostreae]OCB77354.1 aminopeptidase [Flavobacterium crassostreae]
MHPFQFKKAFVVSAFLLGMSSMNAQDGLVNSLKVNASEKSVESFKFTDVINLANTSIKNQGSSGTCWSYSTNSYLESEMIRLGKQPVEISQVFSARNAYLEKGKNYVRMHGAVTLGDGGELHDVINMYKKYGAVPQEVYTGLNYGTSKNKFAEMASITQALLAAVVKNPNGELTPNWEKAYAAVLDTYLGEVPKTFNYKGKSYTPQTFAKEVVGIQPEEYIEFGSYTTEPYYEKTMMMVPDNWSFDLVYNIKMNDITAIIDHALKNGFTVAWASDVSEKSFSWKNGIAYVPNKNYEDMSATEKENMFNGPKQELDITEEMRQKAFDNYQTTDDHAMHIVGISKDQTGKEYYIVKNSWGASNDYKGYLYVSKNFVKYKTTAFLVNKAAVPNDIAKKLKL